MKRSVTTLTLLFTSVSAILGSGWLFTSYYAGTIAGPASLLAWIIAGLAIIFIAFVFAELSAMFPVMGSNTRIPHMTHGTLVGFMYAWIFWLCCAAVPPTETQAIIQYASFYYPVLTHSGGSLTHIGYGVAAGLMLIICALNAFSLRWLLHSNTTLTFMKIIIPLIIIVFVFAKFFDMHTIIHPENMSFMPMGIKGVLAAISAGGMVYAFNGFAQACDWAGAVKKPGFSLPVAIIGSIILTLVIYIGLQLVFLTSVQPFNLIHGWTHFSLERANSPLAAIVYQDHFSHLLPILFIGAIIGPFAAALIYSSSAAQSLRSKSINGYLPKFLQYTSAQHVPVVAVFINFVFGMLLFAPLPGWKLMMGFLSSLMSVTYTIGPICFLVMRDKAPMIARPFRLPMANIWGNLAFYFCTVFSYFNGWEIISKLSAGFLAGLIILLVYRFFSKDERQPKLDWRASTWIWPYIGGLTLISYLGSFGGGSNILPFGWDLGVLAVFSIAIMALARKYTLSVEQTHNLISLLAFEKDREVTVGH